MLHKQMHVLICAICRTHECESNTHTHNSRGFCLHLLSHGVSFQLPLKEAAKVFWFFQELPGNSTPNLPTRARARRPLTMPRCPPVVVRTAVLAIKWGQTETSKTTLKGHLQGASLRGNFGLHTSELPN